MEGQIYQFPLFKSHLDLAHSYWEKVIKEGDWVIDATCGNGKDSLKLAQLISPSGGVISLDIQPMAIENSNNLFTQKLTTEQISRIHLFCTSHESFPAIAENKRISLIVYNLGYLPGGNKEMTTLTEITLKSLNKSLLLLAPYGVISITCYPGHPEGAREQAALLNFAKHLTPSIWSVSHHTWENRKQSPSLLIIQKNT